MGIRFPAFFILSDAIRRGEKSLHRRSRRSLLAQAMLNQPRHVVYHSHYSGIFNSHRADNTKSAECSRSIQLCKER